MLRALILAVAAGAAIPNPQSAPLRESYETEAHLVFNRDN